MTKTFEELHPDVIELLPTCKIYRQFNKNNRVIEAWERDDNNVWHDVTLREQAIEQAKRELAMAKREAAKLEEEQADA